MSQPNQDLLMGQIPAKKSRIVASWVADCGSNPSPRLEDATIEDGLLVAPCNPCVTKGCKVRRHIRTELT